jgi:hypothetical protein
MAILSAMCPIAILEGDPISLFKAKRKAPAPALYPRALLRSGPHLIGVFIVRVLRRLMRVVKMKTGSFFNFQGTVTCRASTFLGGCAKQATISQVIRLMEHRTPNVLRGPNSLSITRIIDA